MSGNVIIKKKYITLYYNMSISNLITNNHFDLFCDSIYSGESFSNFPTAAAQALSTVAPTQLVIDNVAVSPQTANGHLILNPTSYTAPMTGVYHFGGSVSIVYVVTAADFVLQRVQILANGVTSKYVSVDQRTCAAGSTSSVSLPLNCYIALNAGDVVTVHSEAPLSNVGAGNITVNNMTAEGTMWYGCRG